MNASSDGEVYGSNALYLAMVAGAVALLLASIWAPATTDTAQSQPAAAGQQMALNWAASGHV